MVMRNTVFPLMEHAMMSEDMVPSKGIVYRILERFLKNSKFDSNNEMKQLFVVNLKTITTKHLSYYSTFYFKWVISWKFCLKRILKNNFFYFSRFVFKLVKFHPATIKEVLEFLHNQILRVEQLRGSGRDMGLRTNYEKLQGAVKAIMDKK